MKGYRKYSVAMVALTYAFVLALLGKLTPEFATVASISVGAFSAANALKHRNDSSGNGNGSH